MRNGKWCSFNNAYFEQGVRNVGKVSFVNHTNDAWGFNKTDLLEFAKTNGIYVEQKRQLYETYYNKKLANHLGANIILSETIPVDENSNKRYRYEVCDLIHENSMYFVKIGKPSDFAYAIDQAAFTLSKIQNGHGKVILPNGTMFEPNKFHIVLICENRKTTIQTWQDIYSINFLIHTSELKQNLNTMNISSIVDFLYDIESIKLMKK